MPTRIDDSQISSHKLENLIENVGYIKAPLDSENDLPALAEDGERRYIKSLKRDFIYDALKGTWTPFGSASPAVEDKVIMFYIKKPSVGVQKMEFMFPYDGVVSSVTSSLVTSGKTETVIQVQKCSQDNYENNVVWENVGDEFVIPDNKKMTAVDFQNEENNVVLPNDHFRLDIKQLGEQIEGLTINIKIKLT